MSASRIGAILRHEFRLMRHDVETPMFMIAMPLLMMAIFQETFRVALKDQGFAGANGAEQTVPGMTVMFAAFFVGYLGFAFLREHGWGTWERLRASPATSLEIMAGKIAVPMLLSTVQFLVLFLAGVVLFDLKVAGSISALVLISMATSICLLSFGIMVTALSRTSQQLNAMGSAGGMIFATLGGAFVPLAAMPGWTQDLAPAVPTYWAMRGFRSVILEGAVSSEVLLPVAMLLGFMAVFIAVAATKFRFEETKIYYG